MPPAAKAALLATLMLALTAAGTAGSQPRPESMPDRVITIKNIAFNPGKVTVAKGALVAWRYRDGLTFHNVTAAGRRFRSSRDRRDGVHRVRFRRSGRYRYMCTLHGLAMKGVVVVR